MALVYVLKLVQGRGLLFEVQTENRKGEPSHALTFTAQRDQKQRTASKPWEPKPPGRPIFQEGRLHHLSDSEGGGGDLCWTKGGKW